MKLSPREQHDLEELAGIFLSPAPGETARRGARPSPRAGVPPPLSLLVSLAGEGPPGRALVRAAASVAQALSLPRSRPGTIHPLLRPASAAPAAPSSRPGVLPVPSRDGPALRWGLAATSRVLAWTPARNGLLRRVEDFLLALHEGCPAPELGWLRAPEVPFAPVEAALAAWRDRVPGARVEPLGTWQPGEELPAAARRFLEAAPPGRLVPPSADPQTPRQTR